MYHVELLPSGSSHATPGWTYVADRGFDPAKAAITPAIGRKRGIRDPGRADLSSRQNNAIVRHLAELDRENHRDVQIPIPAKQKDAAGRVPEDVPQLPRRRGGCPGAGRRTSPRATLRPKPHHKTLIFRLLPPTRRNP
ncbi:conserved hypothetical protein [Aspergillus terreus NIH2624]|uniref:Uncharacterized protein n=1 Tax=Aspergillus terreus (strain NIH 2624 / FGSC A1156) TaxID=341663 RepID=Q0CJY3_ASPTN|nr:uncharacterized protein ATEG_06001 [Aspergillus terreus NIH2624]EAU33762.1 conserved hypothetical protein [Aspergillus terreus NIH2624]